MWLQDLLAAEAPASGASDSLLVLIGGIVTAALGVLGIVLKELIAGWNARKAPAATPTVTTSSATVDIVALSAAVAVLEDWRRTTREADDIHDRRVDSLEDDVEDLVRWHDREHPGWRP